MRKCDASLSCISTTCRISLLGRTFNYSPCKENLICSTIQRPMTFSSAMLFFALDMRHIIYADAKLPLDSQTNSQQSLTTHKSGREPNGAMYVITGCLAQKSPPSPTVSLGSLGSFLINPGNEEWIRPPRDPPWSSEICRDGKKQWKSEVDQIGNSENSFISGSFHRPLPCAAVTSMRHIEVNTPMLLGHPKLNVKSDRHFRPFSQRLILTI
jgi:hypothetical protein